MSEGDGGRYGKLPPVDHDPLNEGAVIKKNDYWNKNSQESCFSHDPLAKHREEWGPLKVAVHCRRNMCTMCTENFVQTTKTHGL